jgi:hypothetical protein
MDSLVVVENLIGLAEAKKDGKHGDPTASTAFRQQQQISGCSRRVNTDFEPVEEEG